MTASSEPEGFSHHEVGVELRKEGYTMALYVAICLLAALAAIAERGDEAHEDVFKVIWGTTVGLALAHWFAFRVSARLVATGAIRRHDAQAAGAQLGGALVVALLATVPVAVLPESSELDVVRLVLAAFVAAVGFAVARNSGAQHDALDRLRREPAGRGDGDRHREERARRSLTAEVRPTRRRGGRTRARPRRP